MAIHINNRTSLIPALFSAIKTPVLVNELLPVPSLVFSTVQLSPTFFLTTLDLHVCHWRYIFSFFTLLKKVYHYQDNSTYFLSISGRPHFYATSCNLSSLSKTNFLLSQNSPREMYSPVLFYISLLTPDEDYAPKALVFFIVLYISSYR